MARDRLLDQRAGLRAVAGIAGHEGGTAAVVAYRLRRRLAFLLQDIGEDDVCALGGETPGAGRADAAGRAGHHRDLAFESHVGSTAGRKRPTIWRAISSAESSPGLYQAIDQAMAPISARRKYLRLVPGGSGRSSIRRRKTFS